MKPSLSLREISNFETLVISVGKMVIFLGQSSLHWGNVFPGEECDPFTRRKHIFLLVKATFPTSRIVNCFSTGPIYIAANET